MLSISTCDVQGVACYIAPWTNNPPAGIADPVQISCQGVQIQSGGTDGAIDLSGSIGSSAGVPCFVDGGAWLSAPKVVAMDATHAIVCYVIKSSRAHDVAGVGR